PAFVLADVVLEVLGALEGVHPPGKGTGDRTAVERGERPPAGRGGSSGRRIGWGCSAATAPGIRRTRPDAVADFGWSTGEHARRRGIIRLGDLELPDRRRGAADHASRRGVANLAARPQHVVFAADAHAGAGADVDGDL